MIDNASTEPTTLLSPELLALPNDAGPGSASLRETLAFGLDPALAFGAAAGLKKVLNKDSVDEALHRWAGRPTDTPRPASPATPNPAASPAAANPASAASAGNAAAANAATHAAPAATQTTPEATANPVHTAQAAPDTSTAHTAPQSSLDGSVTSPYDGKTEVFDNRTVPTRPDPTVDPTPTDHGGQPGAPEAPHNTGDPARAAAPETAQHAPSPADPDMLRTTPATATPGATTSAPTATTPPATAPADINDPARATRTADVPHPAAISTPDGPRAVPSIAADAPDPHSASRAAAATPKAAPGIGELDHKAPPVRSGPDKVRDISNTIREHWAKNPGKTAVKDLGKLGAKKGGVLATRTAAQALLKLGTLSLPGLGTALTALFWAMDTEGRKEFADIWMSLFSDAMAAPDVNAAPEPPRTHFLPLTHDGGRDPLIDQMDEAMTKTMDTSFGFEPADVWPTVDPAVPTTTNLPGTVTHFNELGTLLGDALDSITAAYLTGTSEPYVGQAWQKSQPGVEALRDVQENALPAIGRLVTDGAVNANDAYQGFRAVNLKNRHAINNSSDGLLGWLIPGIHAEDMSDSVQEMRTAVSGMQRIADQLAAAASEISVKPNGAVAATPSAKDEPDPAPAAPTPVAPPATVAPTAVTPPGQAQTPEQNLKDLASMLADKAAQATPNLGSMIPQVPNLGSMVPDLGSMTPSPSTLGSDLGKTDPALTEDDVAKRLAELKDERDALTEPGPEQHQTPVTPEPVIAPAVTPPANVNPVTDPTPPTQPAAPAASNTAELGDRKVTFDNPKYAAMAQKLFDGQGAVSLYSAAADAGLQVPPPGQHIGEKMPIGAIEQGFVVLGAEERGVYLGELDGQPSVLTESGDIKALADVAKFSGPETGIFKLADNGTPLQTPPAEPSTLPAAQQTGPATPSTDPGVIPGQQTGNAGLNPGVIPTQP